MLFKEGAHQRVIVLTEWGVRHLKSKDGQNQKRRELNVFFPDFFSLVSKIKLFCYILSTSRLLHFLTKREKKVFTN